MTRSAEQIEDFVPSWDTEEARGAWRRRTSLEMIVSGFIGLVTSFVLSIEAWQLAAGVRFPRWYMACTNLLYTVALFFAFWLFSQSYFVIQVLCPWCLLITLTTTLVFGGITRINIRDGVIPAPESVRRIVGQGLDWALWGLIVFGVLAMVVAKYGLKLLG